VSRARSSRVCSWTMSAGVLWTTAACVPTVSGYPGEPLPPAHLATLTKPKGLKLVIRASSESIRVDEEELALELAPGKHTAVLVTPGTSTGSTCTFVAEAGHRYGIPFFATELVSTADSTGLAGRLAIEDETSGDTSCVFSTKDSFDRPRTDSPTRREAPVPDSSVVGEPGYAESYRATIDERDSLNGLLTTLDVPAGYMSWTAIESAQGATNVRGATAGFGVTLGWVANDWAPLFDVSTRWFLAPGATAAGNPASIDPATGVVFLGAGVARYRLTTLRLNAALAGGFARAMTAETGEDSPPGGGGPMAQMRLGKDWVLASIPLALGLQLRGEYGRLEARIDSQNMKDWNVLGLGAVFTVGVVGTPHKRVAVRAAGQSAATATAGPQSTEHPRQPPVSAGRATHTARRWDQDSDLVDPGSDSSPSKPAGSGSAVATSVFFAGADRIKWRGLGALPAGVDAGFSFVSTHQVEVSWLDGPKETRAAALFDIAVAAPGGVSLTECFAVLDDGTRLPASAFVLTKAASAQDAMAAGNQGGASAGAATLQGDAGITPELHLAVGLGSGGGSATYIAANKGTARIAILFNVPVERIRSYEVQGKSFTSSAASPTLPSSGSLFRGEVACGAVRTAVSFVYDRSGQVLRT